MVTHTLQNDNFVIVREETGQEFYGGNQLWFGDKRKVFGGCAPTAAANIFAYMVIKQNDISRAEFVELMNTAYKTIRPLEIPLFPVSLGFFSLLGFAHGFIRWVEKSSPLRLAFHVMPFYSKKCKAAAIQSITEALAHDSPVALLTMFAWKRPKMTLCAQHGILQRYDRHWVTVTRILHGERCLLHVSSWGEPYCIDFDAYWENSNWSHWFLPSGIVWFELI